RRTRAADRDLDAHVQLQRGVHDSHHPFHHGRGGRHSQQQGAGVFMTDESGEKTAAMPWPGHERRGGAALANRLITAGIVALFVWSYYGSDIRLGELFSREGSGQILGYIRKLFPPDLSPSALHEGFRGAVETFAISFLGTLLAFAIGLSVVFFASRNLMYSGLLYEMEPGQWWRRGLRMVPYFAAKALLNVLRTIPEIVWALIFVFIVGLGPFPGTLALGFHTGGVLGKLFSEVLEDVDYQPIEALQST